MPAGLIVLDIDTNIINPMTGPSVTVNGVNLSSPNNDPTNIAIGIVPTSVSISSHNNTLIGGGAAGGLTTGTQNTAIGTFAANVLTTGSDNVAIGINPLFAIVSGSQNIGIGTWAASSQLTGSDTVAIGHSALRFCTGSSNVAIGTSALRNLITGFTNVSIGRNSGQDLTGGTGNTFLGAQSGQAIVTGNYNTFIGYSAGDANILNGSNNLVIGYNAEASNNAVSNEATIGNASITTLRCAVTSITSLSDARDKKEITELSAGLDFVNTLKPVEFVWDDRNEEGKHDIKDFGFIAQDLKQSQEDIELADTLKLVYEENPEKLEASYGKLIPILVKAIQDLSAKVEALESKKKK